METTLSPASALDAQHEARAAENSTASPTGCPTGDQGRAAGDDVDELLPFRIIAQAGKCRALAFEALDCAREGDFVQADEKIAEAKEASLAAHNEQTSLLACEAAGDHEPVRLMMVHAQDHLMTAMLAYELIEEMVRMYRDRAA